MKIFFDTYIISRGFSGISVCTRSIRCPGVISVQEREQKIAAEYSWEKTARETLNVYRKLKGPVSDA